MRLSLQLVLVIALFAVACPLQAAPVIEYWGFMDRFYVINDVPGSIINIKSPTGALNAPSFPKGPLPNLALVDTGDLPHFLAILNTPSGRFDLGQGVIDPGTSISDLSFEWYEYFGRPANPGSLVLVKLEDTPEPTTASLASVAAVALTAMSRRRRSRIETNPYPKQEQA